MTAAVLLVLACTGVFAGWAPLLSRRLPPALAATMTACEG